MSCNTAHVGDIGTTFRATIKDGLQVIPIGAATTLELFFKGPTGAASVRTAVLTTDGTDGKMEYITSSGTDLDEPGEWRWQAHVVLPSGEWRSEVRTFTVEDNLA